MGESVLILARFLGRFVDDLVTLLVRNLDHVVTFILFLLREAAPILVALLMLWSIVALQVVLAQRKKLKRPGAPDVQALQGMSREELVALSEQIQEEIRCRSAESKLAELLAGTNERISGEQTRAHGGIVRRMGASLLRRIRSMAGKAAALARVSWRTHGGFRAAFASRWSGRVRGRQFEKPPGSDAACRAMTTIDETPAEGAPTESELAVISSPGGNGTRSRFLQGDSG